MKIGLVLLLLPAVCMVGCDRTHLAAGYGKSVRHAFNAQVDLTASGSRSNSQVGLDPEEAAIVLKTYKKSLSPSKDDEPANRSPIIMLSPPGAAGSAPAPYSVNP
ncbi:MAG: hypothetical protein EXR72_06735 [Myxococcales bacterium]|nr:hypothetical protein [Myxococcales bacterium]